MTFEELNDRVDGALANALQTLVGDERSLSLQRQCATNLRAGRIRLVIAVDFARDDLVRIVQYISDHSDIDVRLVTISQFDDGKILVPRILVSQASDRPGRIGRPKPPKEVDPFFAAVVAAYDKIAGEELQSRGRGRKCRKIHPDEWAGKDILYEFYNYDDEVGIELHLESDDVRGLALHLTGLSGQELLPGIPLEWDPKWFRSRGRLIAKIDKQQTPELGAKLMHELIIQSRDIIEGNLDFGAER